MQTRARGREPLARVTRDAGCKPTSGVPVDAPLPQRGDTGPDGRKKRADTHRTDARGRR